MLTYGTLLLISNLYSEEKKTYTLTPDPIDVVFVCHEKDTRTLDLAITGIKTYGVNIRNITVVSEKKFTDKATWFNEALFPFTKIDVATTIFNDKEKALRYLAKTTNRIGWIYQQLLKLYAPSIIPNISPNVLIIDADTIFLNRTTFMDPKGNPFFNVSKEFNKDYFDHAARLIPSFKKIHEQHSGITNYMLFQKPILNDFLKTIRTIHNQEPWQALCKCIDSNRIFASISEYELYFNFALARTDQAIIRPLKHRDIKFDMKLMYACCNMGDHYVSCHTWMEESIS